MNYEVGVGCCNWSFVYEGFVRALRLYLDIL